MALVISIEVRLGKLYRLHFNQAGYLKFGRLQFCEKFYLHIFDYRGNTQGGPEIRTIRSVKNHLETYYYRLGYLSGLETIS